MTIKLSNRIYPAILSALILGGCGSDGSTEDSPATEADDASQVLRISEVLTKDQAGGPDWIEIEVVGDESVNLAGYSLSDSTNDPASLPEITLQAGQYVVIQATDDAPTDGSYYVPFKLSSDDSVTLTYDGTVIDSLAWQDSDVKTGRTYGEYNGLVQRLYPTPGADNIAFNAFLTDEVVKVELELSDEDWQAILADPTAEEYKTAVMTYNGIEVADIGFRTKGNSSLSGVANDPDSIRYSFKADINYYQQDQKFLGLKKLNFNNIYADPSMMREYLSYQMMDDMGVPAPRISYVDLYIKGQHMGLYNVVEAIDSEFVERHFDYEEGDLYKAAGTSTLVFIDYASESYSGLELKTNEETSQKQILVDFIAALQSSEPASLLNLDLFLRYLAVNTFLVNLDSYQGPFAHNFYLYQDINDQGEQITMLPWDYNMSINGFPAGCSSDIATNFLIDQPTTVALAERPLVAKILEIEAYKATYHQYLTQVITEAAEYSKMSAKIDVVAALIDPYVAGDPTKFFDYETWQTSLTDTVESQSMGGAPNAGGEPPADGEAGPVDGEAQPVDGEVQPIGGEVLPVDGELPPMDGLLPPTDGELPPGGAMPGNQETTIIGLREFLIGRIDNVGKQLSGEKPSTNSEVVGGCSL